MTEFIDKVPQSVADQLAAELDARTVQQQAEAAQNTADLLKFREENLAQLGAMGISAEAANGMLPNVEDITNPNPPQSAELTASTVVTRGLNLGGGYYGDPRPQQ